MWREFGGLVRDVMVVTGATRMQLCRLMAMSGRNLKRTIDQERTLTGSELEALSIFLRINPTVLSVVSMLSDDHLRTFADHIDGDPQDIALPDLLERTLVMDVAKAMGWRGSVSIDGTNSFRRAALRQLINASQLDVEAATERSEYRRLSLA